MNDSIIKQFADKLLTLAPGIEISADEVQTRIINQGLSGFIREIGGDATGLAETAELLARLEEGQI